MLKLIFFDETKRICIPNPKFSAGVILKQTDSSGRMVYGTLIYS